jgi:ankyrin repeat protein
MQRNLQIIDLLMIHGVDPGFIVDVKSPDSKSASALATVIETDTSNDQHILRKLLETDMDINEIVQIKYGCGYTALSAAIESRNIPALELLVELGADLHTPIGEYERTPLQAACARGNVEAVKILLRHGADVNFQPADQYGATALQFAAIGGHVGIAYLLLCQGAQVNAPPAKVNGRTALEGAAEHGRIDMLQLLIDAGADIRGGSKQFIRAVELAERERHFAAKLLLESAQAGTLQSPGMESPTQGSSFTGNS